MNLLDDDWKREKINQLRKLILSSAKDFDEGINYKMLSYGDDRGILFHLNAQKNYVSLYVGDAKKIDPKGILLKGIDVGKGCIRLKKSHDINSTRLEEFIIRAVQMWKDGKDVDC